MPKSDTLKEARKNLNRALAASKKMVRARLKKEAEFGINKRDNKIEASILAADEAARQRRRQRARKNSAKSEESPGQNEGGTE